MTRKFLYKNCQFFVFFYTYLRNWKKINFLYKSCQFLVFLLDKISFFCHFYTCILQKKPYFFCLFSPSITRVEAYFFAQKTIFFGNFCTKILDFLNLANIRFSSSFIPTPTLKILKKTNKIDKKIVVQKLSIFCFF